MKPAKILFCGAFGSGAGGVETWVAKLCRFLLMQEQSQAEQSQTEQSQQQSVRKWKPLIALGCGSAFHQPEKFRELYPDLPTIEIDGRGFDREGRTREVMNVIQRVQPDIVIPLSMIEANEAVCRLKQQGTSIRMVVHAQGNLPAILADLKRYQSGVDMLGCPGLLTKQFAIEVAKYPEQRVQYIPNGADLPWGERIERKEKTPLRLGYVGRLTQGDKRCLDIIPFIKTLNEKGIAFQFDIVGAGGCEQEIRNGLQKEIELGQVRMRGRMGLEEISKTVYSQLDALLLFSASESFGIVLIEAMMHGVVPVTSRYIGFETQKLVVENQNGLTFAIGDMETAVLQIQKLANDDSLRLHLSQTGQQSTQEKFQWEHVLEKWIQLFETVLNREPIRCKDWQAVASPSSGFLNRLPLPSAIIHQIRKLRKSLVGVSTTSDEWSFRNNDYSVEELNEIEKHCLSMEDNAEESLEP